MICIIAIGSWTAYQEIPCLNARYDDGTTVLPNSAPMESFTEVSFNSGSDPDERGVVWVQPFDGELSDFHTRIKFNDVDRDCDIVLYDVSSNVLDSVSLEPDKVSSAITSRDFLELPFSRTRLYEGRTYRMSIKPTTANSITVLDMEFGDANLRATNFGFGYFTSRTDAGSWTDDTTRGIELTPVISRLGSNRRVF
jgi:hypothetical protein